MSQVVVEAVCVVVVMVVSPGASLRHSLLTHYVYGSKCIRASHNRPSHVDFFHGSKYPCNS